MFRFPLYGPALLLLLAVAVVPGRVQSADAARPASSEGAAAAAPPSVGPASSQTDAAQPSAAVATEPPPEAAPPKSTPSKSAPSKPTPSKPTTPGATTSGQPKPARSRPAPAAEKPAVTASIQGRLELVAGQKQTVAAGEVTAGLVYFLPKAGNPKPKPGYFTVNTSSKGFSPSLLVVPAGSTLAFPNRDTVLHNVFSRTPGNAFDFGNYGPGQSRQQVFAKPGLVIVNCSVHHSMRATVVVMATPYYTRPDKNGRFELTGLPSGAGTLVYWHPRAAAATVQITLPSATAQKQQLVASKPRNDHHGMN
jgi:plastocyanin